MLGRVTCQFIKAERALKSLVSLETKFQEKPWAPKYPSAPSGLCLCLLLLTLQGPVAQSPVRCQQCPGGTAQHVPRADLSLPQGVTVTAPGTCREDQETPRETPESTQGPDCEQSSSKGEGNCNSELRVKRSTTATAWDRLLLINLTSTLLNIISVYV